MKYRLYVLTVLCNILFLSGCHHSVYWASPDGKNKIFIREDILELSENSGTHFYKILDKNDTLIIAKNIPCNDLHYIKTRILGNSIQLDFLNGRIIENEDTSVLWVIMSEKNRERDSNISDIERKILDGFWDCQDNGYYSFFFDSTFPQKIGLYLKDDFQKTRRVSNLEIFHNNLFIFDNNCMNYIHFKVDFIDDTTMTCTAIRPTMGDEDPLIFKHVNKMHVRNYLKR